MATYAIGDIQGCHRTLMRLLDRLAFDRDRDRLWLAGDLVNRGPDSLAVLRWARDLGDRVVAVLGNHDLRLLAVAHGKTFPRDRDTLDEVMGAPDRDELVEWLAQRPFLHREGDRLLLHAGLAPAWSADRAEALAAEASAVLRSSDRPLLLEALLGEVPQRWDDGLTGLARHAAVVAMLTRLRTCTADGTACFEFSGAPADAPPGCLPWFEVPGRRSADRTAIFGHWAALGLVMRPGVLVLDTGCVWGGFLTAVCLEDSRVFQEPSAEIR